MKVNLDFQPALEFYRTDINSVKDKIFNIRKTIISKGVKVIKASVVKNLSRSEIDNPLYTHMQDDVKTTIKDDGQGDIVGIIHGGKKTGYKWHMLNDGTSHSKATHFVEKSLKDVESDLDAIVNQAIWEAIQ